MGTAVLYPQDCLPSAKDRREGHLSEALVHSESDFRTTSGVFHGSSLKDLSIVCSNDHKRNSFPGRGGGTSKFNTLRAGDHGDNRLAPHKEEGGTNLKASRLTEVKDLKAASKFTCESPVVTILRRPKSKEAADDLIVKFLLKVEEESVMEGEHNRTLEASEMWVGRTAKNHEFHHSPSDKPRLQHGLHRKSIDSKLPKFNSKKGSTMIAESSKVLHSALSSPNLVNKARSLSSECEYHTERSHYSVPPRVTQPKTFSCVEDHCESDHFEYREGLSQLAGLKVMSEQKSNLKKAGVVAGGRHFKQFQQIVLRSSTHGGLSRLKRATTDPQIVQQLNGRRNSEVVDIPVINAKSCNGLAKIKAMSFPERWAGPSYYSSPAPSSLPLPKFSVPYAKATPNCISKEVCVRSVLESPEVGPLSPQPCSMQGVQLDAAFATKSLRRMLKLDPC